MSGRIPVEFRLAVAGDASTVHGTDGATGV